MKKVCHLTSVHHRYDTRILYKECVSLAKNGWEIHLVVADGQEDELINGVQIHSVGKQKGKLKRILKSPKEVYRKAIQIDAEIYHFHDPELMPVGARIKRHGKTVVYDAHEDLPRAIQSKDYIPGYLRKPLSFFVELYENRMASKYDYIITATPHIKKRFDKLNSNVSDINNYPLLADLDTKVTPWGDKKNEVCYVGSITKIRGLEQVVSAMDYLKEIRLSLAGSAAPHSFLEDLKQIPGWEQTDFLGQIKREEVKNILKKSKVGIVTFLPFGNHIHSQPNKLFEYMAQGIPLVASDFDLWRDIIEKVECGLCVNPYNPRDIADAIAVLLSDDIKAQQMGENGRNVVLSEYNWESEEKKLLSIYKQL